MKNTHIILVIAVGAISLFNVIESKQQNANLKKEMTQESARLAGLKKAYKIAQASLDNSDKPSVKNKIKKLEKEIANQETRINQLRRSL